MIVGLGVDLCDISRLGRVMERWGDRMTRRVFTEHELQVAGRGRVRLERLAARFAAKEATRKALGAHAAGRLLDVEVRTAEGSRAPRLALHGRASERALQLKVTGSHISLTHEAGMAVAVVVLEGGEERQCSS